jgi:hypothetical protein
MGFIGKKVRVRKNCQKYFRLLAVGDRDKAAVLLRNAHPVPPSQRTLRIYTTENTFASIQSLGRHRNRPQNRSFRFWPRSCRVLRAAASIFDRVRQQVLNNDYVCTKVHIDIASKNFKALLPFGTGYTLRSPAHIPLRCSAMETHL